MSEWIYSYLFGFTAPILSHQFHLEVEARDSDEYAGQADQLALCMADYERRNRVSELPCSAARIKQRRTISALPRL